MSVKRLSQRVPLIVLVLLVAGSAGGCKSAFRSQAEIVAENIGRSADDVERAFQRALPGATEAELEVAATKSASETQWIKSLGARFTAEWERQATLRTIAGSTCDYLGLFQKLGGATTSEQVQQVIRQHIQRQGLVATDKKVLDILEGIIKQLDSLLSRGTVNVNEAIQDLACLPF